MTCLHIIDLDATHESLTLRMVGEQLGYEVSLTLVGNSTQVVKDLGSERKFDLLIINGHGASDQFILPELAEEIKANYPYADRIGVTELNEFLNLQADCVIGNCCSVGSEPIAQAFLDHGAKAYIGPDGYPDGIDGFKLMVDFLYWYRLSGNDPEQALAKAKIPDNDSQMYKKWHLK